MGLNALTDGLCSDISIKANLMERGEIMVEGNECLIIDERTNIPLIRWYLSDAEECDTVINNPISNVINVDGVWDGKNPEVSTASECTMTNLLDTRGEEHGIQGSTIPESPLFNGFNILM
eukprot:CAMPEP_0204613602 /NCGR_PEP_ID=MMETSP0717-20131115/1549_1 /ASSEMBLY_ACC=CAM_ASM_000666 /TAXON_ID=230516 /ORGANISM="Chaetoceros curvisetus" /LENGTH=119 /DNA_ID=CAMNT_0051626077 /DNA_START=12 /DNA_END=368 /DNA_ORIENTATION=+